MGESLITSHERSNVASEKIKRTKTGKTVFGDPEKGLYQSVVEGQGQCPG